MCWLDKCAVNQFLTLKDEYNISTYLETGTFRGTNVRFYSFHFPEVIGCDIDDNYIKISRQYNEDRDNVRIEKIASRDFLRNFVAQYYRDKRTDIVFIFLDAHFYNAALMPNEKWVVKEELMALAGFENCVICIHDFDCSGLGHCCYGGEPLGFPLVLPWLNLVNPNFHYYVNDKSSASMVTPEEAVNLKGVVLDDNAMDTIKFANGTDILKYRGYLYCTPTELDLNRYNIRRA
jgi:hypothetical protein